MGQAELEILKMVAEKVITAEEGERLLRALAEGAAGRREEDAAGHRHGHGHHGHHGLHGPHGWFGGGRFGDFLGGVGAMVEDAVEEAIGELHGDFDAANERFAEVPLEDGHFALPAGSRLLVKHRPLRGFGLKRGDVELFALAGDAAIATGHPKAGLAAFRTDGRVVLAFARGPIRVGVPETVTAVTVVSTGGAVRAEGLLCPAELKTMGGDVVLERVAQPVSAKTMGGNMRLGLAPGLTGETRLVTMGGDIDVGIPDGVSAMVRASCIGHLDVDPALGAVRRGTDLLFGKAAFQVGEPPPGDETSVRLKTMGGTIRLKRS